MLYIYTHITPEPTPNTGQKHHETIAGATPTQHPQRPHSIQNYRKHIVKQMKTAQTGNPSLNPPPGRSMSMGVVPSSYNLQFYTKPSPKHTTQPNTCHRWVGYCFCCLFKGNCGSGVLVGCVGAAPGHTLEPPTTITHKPPNSYMLNMGCTENVAAAAATARNGMNQKWYWIHNAC